jgi:hypothetical protein
MLAWIVGGALEVRGMTEELVASSKESNMAIVKAEVVRLVIIIMRSVINPI